MKHKQASLLRIIIIIKKMPGSNYKTNTVFRKFIIFMFKSRKLKKFDNLFKSKKYRYRKQKPHCNIYRLLIQFDLTL